MKIIDLLNKIANGEEVPEMFKYNDKIWRLASNRTYFIGSDYGYDFWIEHGNDKFEDEIITLNDEIEILEDTPKEEKKIPEKVDFDISKFNYKEYELGIMRNNVIANTKTINKIIDYLKSKGDE